MALTSIVLAVGRERGTMRYKTIIFRWFVYFSLKRAENGENLRILFGDFGGILLEFFWESFEFWLGIFVLGRF
jgi:hypothetical protein